MKRPTLSLSAKQIREVLHALDSLDPTTEFAELAASEDLDAALWYSLYPRTRDCDKIERQSSDARGDARRAAGIARMHPRNVFANIKADFFVLGKRQPCFRPFVEQCSLGLWYVNFKSWEVTRALNRALLVDVYGLVSWDIPKGHLCPPVPNRASYIHWLEDLLQLSHPCGRPGIECEGVRGIDIGVGSNCVFPLLGSTANRWSFIGIDVTDVALIWADKNRLDNPDLASRIKIRDARRSGTLHMKRNDSAVLAVQMGERFSFCMCNPPFFETMKHAKRNPGTNFGGTLAELCCTGGEETFIRRMYNESLVTKDRVHWYTTMCGKKETLKSLRCLLDTAKVPAIRTARFLQGKTVRWGVAWSFSAQALPISTIPLRSGVDIKFDTVPHSRSCWRITFEPQAVEGSCLAEKLAEQIRLVLEKCGCAISPDSRLQNTFNYRCVMEEYVFPTVGSNRLLVKILQPLPGAVVVVTAACDDKSATNLMMQRRFKLVWEAIKARISAQTQRQVGSRVDWS